MVIRYKNSNIDVAENASGADVAKELLGADEKKIVAVKKNGQIQDLFMPLGESCEIDFVSLESEEGKRILRHSAAHVMAHAIKTIYPTAKLTIGPATDDGFFYDIDFKSQIGEGDLEKIENEMKSIVKANFRIERKEISRKEALEMAEEEDETYKIDIIKQIPDGEKITIYKQGEWFDICRGPHVRSTGMIKAFKLTKIAGAYLHGDQKNKMLTRIYGVAFPSKAEMEEYFARLEEAKQRDHVKIGRELEYFTTVDIIGQGLPVMLPRGAKTIQLMQRFVEDEEERRGYLLTKTPYMTKSDLFKVSGHLDHYRDSMYIWGEEGVDKEVMCLRPMTCPFQYQVFLNKLRSYKDLPMRLGETSTLFRKEASGECHGLIRLRQFTISEGHLIVAPSQLEEEFKGCLDLAIYMLKTLGLYEDVSFRFSKWDENNREKYIGDKKDWERVQGEMRKILNDLGVEYFEADGEAAFYGPKLDIQIKNVHGKEDTIITIQIDFQIAERFGMYYVDENGQKKLPYIIHRTSIGCYERTLAYLLEKYAGNLPLWMCADQLVVIPVSEKFEEYAKKINDKLVFNGFRSKVDTRSEKMGYKIREAQLQKIPYMVIVGEKEEQSGTISVRKRGNIEEKDVNVDEFVMRLAELVRTKSLEIK